MKSIEDIIQHYKKEDNTMDERTMKEKLLDLAYRIHAEAPFNTQREFDCLIYLIGDGTIDTFEELAKYGYEEADQ